jgi:hypothetical protein
VKIAATNKVLPEPVDLVSVSAKPHLRDPPVMGARQKKRSGVGPERCEFNREERSRHP